MATRIFEYEKLRCGRILDNFMKCSITSVSYFGKTFTNAEDFNRHIKTLGIVPKFPVND